MIRYVNIFICISKKIDMHTVPSQHWMPCIRFPFCLLLQHYLTLLNHFLLHILFKHLSVFFGVRWTESFSNRIFFFFAQLLCYQLYSSFLRVFLVSDLLHYKGSSCHTYIVESLQVECVNVRMFVCMFICMFICILLSIIPGIMVVTQIEQNVRTKNSFHLCQVNGGLSIVSQTSMRP